MSPFKSKLPTRRPSIGDRDLLFEAVANLVDNAVKFTPEGGRVTLALLRRDGESVIRVKDTGPGIPEAEREAVVKRFYRSDKSRNTEGLGLGLSLVAAIVKLHGFRFTIASRARLHDGDRISVALSRPASGRKRHRGRSRS